MNSKKKGLRDYYKISTKDAVLDIGCGAKPFPLATHLGDVDVDFCKESLKNAGDPRPFTEASVMALPFDDKSFDFIFCTHVLEHVTDPAKACQEIMRVGKRGYIECPRAWIEILWESEDHKWLVTLDENCLTFKEKTQLDQVNLIGTEIFSLSDDILFKNFWHLPEVKAMRNVRFYWEGTFDFKVVPAHERNNDGMHRWFYSADEPEWGFEAPSKVRTLIRSNIQRKLREKDQ